MSLKRKTHRNVKDLSLRSVLLDLDDYLDSHYLFRFKKEYQGFLGRFKARYILARMKGEEEAESPPPLILYHKGTGNPIVEQTTDQEKRRVLRHSIEPKADVEVNKVDSTSKPEFKITNPFSRYLMDLMASKNLNHVETYKKANLDRQLFSKIMRHKAYNPGKKTILALAIAMELTLPETNALLAKAGYCLSSSILFDVIVQYFIEHGKYNFHEINAALYNYDQQIF